MTRKVYCGNCKYHTHYLDLYPHDKCRANTEVISDAVTRWESYRDCISLNSKNDCTVYEPSLWMRFKTYLKG